MKVFIDKRTMNAALFFSLHIWHRRKMMLAVGWGLKKGEWWYDDESRSKVKFFSVEHKPSENDTRYGLYIGRLGIVCILTKQGGKANDRHQTTAV